MDNYQTFIENLKQRKENGESIISLGWDNCIIKATEDNIIIPIYYYICPRCNHKHNYEETVDKYDFDFICEYCGFVDNKPYKYTYVHFKIL